MTTKKHTLYLSQSKSRPVLWSGWIIRRHHIEEEVVIKCPFMSMNVKSAAMSKKYCKNFQTGRWKNAIAARADFTSWYLIVRSTWRAQVGMLPITLRNREVPTPHRRKKREHLHQNQKGLRNPRTRLLKNQFFASSLPNYSLKFGSIYSLNRLVWSEKVLFG